MLVDDALCQQKSMMWQRGNNIAMSLDIRDEKFELNNCVLFARPLDNESSMDLMTSYEQIECHEERLNNIIQTVVLSTLDSMTVSFSGAWVIEMLKIPQAATLFSFLDYQAKCRNTMSEHSEQEVKASSLLIHTERSLAVLVDEEHKSMMGMLISSLLTPQDRRLESLFSFIRSLESFWISQFLLSQVMNEDKESDGHKISHASKLYGVSESYFRKLCYHAFSRGPKKQLRIWRAAQSVLQLIEKDNSISVIAGNNGYASSSHFSSEIKLLFGITPKAFKKLEDLLHE